jgi:hypothetical protein
VRATPKAFDIEPVAVQKSVEVILRLTRRDIQISGYLVEMHARMRLNVSSYLTPHGAHVVKR